MGHIPYTSSQFFYHNCNPCQSCCHWTFSPNHLCFKSNNLKKMDRLSIQTDDPFIDLWKDFFNTMGIKERENPQCQRNLMPLWYRKHMTEFQFYNSSSFKDFMNASHPSTTSLYVSSKFPVYHGSAISLGCFE